MDHPHTRAGPGDPRHRQRPGGLGLAAGTLAVVLAVMVIAQLRRHAAAGLGLAVVAAIACLAAPRPNAVPPRSAARA